MSIGFTEFKESCLALSNYLNCRLFVELIKEKVSLLNVSHLYHYIVLEPKFYDDALFNGFYETVWRFLYDLANLMGDLFALLYYVAILVAKVAFLIFPHAVKLSRAILKFHREKLSLSDIIMEVLLLVLVALYFYFRKRLQRAWTKFQSNLSRKSEKAAKVLPHLLFFSSAGVVAVFGSKFLLPLTSKRSLPFFTVGLPLIRSIQFLQKGKTGKVTDFDKDYVESVVLWIVLSIYFAIEAICELIPFSSLILKYGYYVREFTLVTAIWVQASPTCANLVFETVLPLIQHYTSKIPAAHLGTSTSLETFFYALRFVGVPDRILKAVKGLMEDGVAVLVMIVFLFMPSRLASIGVVIIALLLPAYKSSNCVCGRDKNCTVKKLKSADSNQKLSVMTPKMWLEYWTLLGVLMFLRFYNFRLWPSSMMVLCLWLQNASFNGSSIVIEKVVTFINALSCYKRKPTSTSDKSLIDDVNRLASKEMLDDSLQGATSEETILEEDIPQAKKKK